MVTDITTTATVETLTAEVRVLMVGNRQVTLSVARQLDEVPLFAIEMFGRIRMDNREYNVCQVIGRSKVGNGLVVSYYSADAARYAGFLEWYSDSGRYSRELRDHFTAEGRQRFYELSVEASGLPLIVLAGLR